MKAESTTLLSVENLHAHYGKSHVLHGVDLQVGRGEVVSLVGRNGSGRSTTMKAIMGLVRPSAGQVRLRGRELAGARPYAICRAGLAYVPEEREVFANLTVDENLRMGEQPPVPGAHRWTVEQMFDYFPRLKERRNTKAGSMSGGEQQMLTICRSLLGNPLVMLIDEPTEGLAPKIVAQVGECIRDMHRKGVSVVLVEQKLTIALKVSTRICVMGHGRIVFEGSPQELGTNEALVSQWLAV
ncbi:ABC transporter ATP-binding protein [Bordetella pseudohinzii]|uniref:ABC transporter ATP-binding protein n=1 Tax=Bordetella pseudohinzii TaxID=1331258 RepID=A0A0J6BVG1_9BORD|nr:ABC transporter ATP-binding protein [Bordetella pseudohinzii]ANY17531.1 ABC transporter ATP-binding protein [Bordetella pseudohinzii]KMM25759.1 mannosyltransferase [Bordetella pseudohinzii]KXA81748.1 ABC transporter ATP-binding protein [Bordetella pseudohinzii]KXA83013.1 ABC transporter ATP-binding protein [Bordetella pseudohinzii]CUI73289.1 LIV-I protein F [Bordetella pseudohinzii]